MKEDIKKSWGNFLNPKTLRSNLIVASVFLSAFEILKECIIERPKEMHTNGFNEDGLVVNEKYKVDVLSLNKSPLYASLEWFRLRGVINQKDIDLFTEIKTCRNAQVSRNPFRNDWQIHWQVFFLIGPQVFFSHPRLSI